MRMEFFRQIFGATGSLAIARAQMHTVFWKARSLFSRLAFRVDRFSSTVKKDVETLSYTRSIYRELLSISLKGIIAACVFVIIVETVEHFAAPAIAEITPNWIVLSPENSEFLSIVGQIGAVFLGIYFATFGIILSSSYSQIRSDVVDLILREKVNNVYSSYLINLTILCLISIGLSYLGYETGYTIFFTVLLGGLVAILCIFELGKRLFLFFDVSRLVDAEILPEVTRLIGEVSNSGRRSIHLDAHRQKVVEQRLSTLRYLSFNSSNALGQSSKPNRKVDRAFAGLLIYYAEERPKIPAESYWFKRTPKHPEWFFESDSSTSMALETDMHLFPKEEIDERWFEDALLDGLLASFRQSLELEDYSAAYSTLQYAQSANEAIATLLLADEGISFLKRFSDLTSNHEIAPELPLDGKKGKPDIQEISLHLGLTQASYMFAYEYLRSAILFAEKLQNLSNGINWAKPDFSGFPAPVLVRLQNTKARIAFERLVEGRPLMPVGYITQLIAKEFTTALKDGLEAVIQEMRRTTTEAVRSRISDKREHLATPILLSSFRSATQFAGFMDHLGSALESAYALEVYPEYEITKIDTTAMREEFLTLRSDLLDQLCSMPIIGFLASDLGKAEELPDYFGQSYFLLAEECYRACRENDPRRFKKLFLAFGILAQIAFSRFEDKKGKVSDEYFLSLLGTIAEDMLALTGYAIAFGELHESDDFKSEADKVWESLLANAKDRQGYLRWIIAISSALRESFYAGPRNIIRTRWSMGLNHVLRDQGFDDGMSYDYGAKQHPSAVIRCIAGIGMSRPSEAAIFLLLLEKVEGDFELPRAVADFKASFEREAER
ncbi:hypothetical protein P7228_12805 [Altererythrobacter arenosus]|uniref:DUF2254 domain-containing protein n=1 Tax=Altererythrobacter arenosus TaxID=3032592 RepID=A0ABY8FUQ9_9SPHN|nr:hypothetical protein [Altererythrobacter sp. CAU 1644]WFL76866.1 hypothetical protein P7228_12805 [Altererythrobacter sp. CAU 1644]